MGRVRCRLLGCRCVWWRPPALAEDCRQLKALADRLKVMAVRARQADAAEKLEQEALRLKSRCRQTSRRCTSVEPTCCCQVLNTAHSRQP